jgi:hypothetical protein
MFTPNAKAYEYKSWHVLTSSILAFWIFGAENYIVWGRWGGGGARGGWVEQAAQPQPLPIALVSGPNQGWGGGGTGVHVDSHIHRNFS